MSIVILPLSFAIESPSVIYALEVFGILWGVLSTLLALFAPKVFYIIEQPANSRASMTNKSMTNTATASRHSMSEKTNSQQEDYKGVWILLFDCLLSLDCKIAK